MWLSESEIDLIRRPCLKGRTPKETALSFLKMHLEFTPPNQECKERIRGVAAACGGGRCFSAIEAYFVGTQCSARGACESDRMLFEMGSDFLVQSPPDLI